MGIIAWIALGMAVGLLANMLLPGKDHGRLFSSARLAALAGAAVMLLACRRRRAVTTARSGS
jgi:uncharacterized membrane protein YeaQ/YmgE (transglycosylase-associated protein family)